MCVSAQSATDRNDPGWEISSALKGRAHSDAKNAVSVTIGGRPGR
jgi:hypothetical protein